MKILVIGGAGMVGSELVRQARLRNHQVAATYYSRKPNNLDECYKLDIISKSEVDSVLKAAEPQWVVLTSAMTNVDQCEIESSRAWLTNALGPGNVAYACEKEGAKLMFISTDYVFDGEKGQPYVEDDTPSPISVYGHTKLAGERLVSGVSKSSVIVRTSVVYDWLTQRQGEIGQSTNFAMWVVKKLKEGEEIKATDEQYNSPTFNGNLVQALLRLLEDSRRGLFHVSGKTCTSRYSFAQKIAEIFGLNGNLIKAGETSILGRAPRPRNSCLDTHKVESVGVKLQTLEEGILMMRENARGS